MKTYRQGAIGALLDIYEEAIADLKETINSIPDNVLVTIIDPDTSDTNCMSIQSILSHVVHSGYGYATSIHNLKPDKLIRPKQTFHSSIQAYLKNLDEVFDYTNNILGAMKDEHLEQLNNSLKIITGWGQQYDAEQLMEHAIVHVLRYNRQIKKIKAFSLLYNETNTL